MPRLKYSLLAVAGIVLLAVVLSVIGPKRALAALGYTPIRDVDNPARQPFQQSFHFVTNNGLDSSSLTIPPNKRLVIEFISTTFSNGSSGTLQVGSADTTIDPYVTLPANQPSYFGVTGNLQLHFYCEPGSTVPVTTVFNARGSNALNVADVTLVGYYVNLP